MRHKPVGAIHELPAKISKKRIGRFTNVHTKKAEKILLCLFLLAYFSIIILFLNNSLYAVAYNLCRAFDT